MKKAQAANEAAIIIGMMTMFLIIFIAVMADQLLTVIDERAYALAEDLGDSVSAEFFRANKAEEGYSRTFETPPTIRGRSYLIRLSQENLSDDNINISQVIITINLSGGARSVSDPLPKKVSGVIVNGTKHCIKKFVNGSINVSRMLLSTDTCNQKP